MPANILMNWNNLAPDKDFYESFVAPLLMGQQAKSRQLEQEQAQIQNQFLPQRYQSEIMGQELMNQGRQAELPYIAKNKEAELMGQLLMNEGRQLENQYAPQEMQMKQQQHAQANALRQMQMQKIRAEIERANNPEQFNPLTDAHGIAQQIATANWYEQNGDPESAKLIRDSLNDGSGQALAIWRSTPQPIRRDMIALARGMGYDEATATKMLASGTTLEEMAGLKGIEDISTVERIYGPSPQQINAAQGRTAADVELNSLTKDYTDWVAPYVNPLNVGGYSWDEIFEVAKGEISSPKRNKFIAGTMLAQELPMLRIRLGQGMNGIEAIREMKEVSMVHLNSLKERITSEDFKEINELVSNSLGKAANLANKSIFNAESAITEANKKYGKSGNKSQAINEDEDLDAEIARLKAELGE
jgi:ABC-type branched-subunit amino acid transport system substrate-binding protein